MVVYVDNAQNRELGRVGKPHGSASVPKTGEKIYADNAQNRKLGRVGKSRGRKSRASARKSSKSWWTQWPKGLKYTMSGCKAPKHQLNQKSPPYDATSCIIPIDTIRLKLVKLIQMHLEPLKFTGGRNYRLIFQTYKI